jgi:4-amino-4-deoxy-L-arabinose transferase-like glycosyltransferase
MAGILIFAYSWVPGGLDVDSCNYAVVAKEILRTNRWLKIYDPVYQGIFYYHFPLSIWITAIFFKFFAVSAFTAKLFSMVSGVILVGVLFYFGRLLKNNWAGFFAGLGFLLTNHIIRLSRQSRMDIPVSLFITLSLFSFFLAQRRSRKYYLLFGLFSCLAIFTKDIYGLFPLAIAFLYLILRLKWKELFHPLFISGLLTAIAPVWAWILLDGKTLFNGWFYWNFLHLLKSSYFNVPWYYYIRVIITKYFYFLPFALYGGYLAIKEARKFKNFEFYLLIIWALIFPLAFSFGRQKIHYFILPMYPATSLLVGLAVDRILKEAIKLRIVTGLKYVLILMGVIMLCFPWKIQSRRFIEIVRIAPHIDQLLKNTPEYEFIVYKQDVASILFYSQELKRVKSVKDKESLVNTLQVAENKPRFIFTSERDFAELNLDVREDYQIVLKYKDRIIVVSPKTLIPYVTLPPLT